MALKLERKTTVRKVLEVSVFVTDTDGCLRRASARADARIEVVPRTAARIIGSGSVTVVETGLAQWMTAWTSGRVS